MLARAESQINSHGHPQGCFHQNWECGLDCGHPMSGYQQSKVSVATSTISVSRNTALTTKWFMVMWRYVAAGKGSSFSSYSLYLFLIFATINAKNWNSASRLVSTALVIWRFSYVWYGCCSHFLYAFWGKLLTSSLFVKLNLPSSASFLASLACVSSSLSLF